MESHENSFWKQSNRAVPGRPSPKKQDIKVVGGIGRSGRGPVGATSFQDFQESVRDAWDMGDDEFCIISGMSGWYLYGFSFLNKFYMIIIFFRCKNFKTCITFSCAERHQNPS